SLKRLRFCLDTSTSLGLKFCNNLSIYSALPWEVKNSPVEISKNATPMYFLSKYTEQRKLLDFDTNTSSLSATPGVTNSVTPRFTMVLVCLGSSSWSQMATRSPAFTNLGK